MDNGHAQLGTVRQKALNVLGRIGPGLGPPNHP